MRQVNSTGPLQPEPGTARTTYQRAAAGFEWIAEHPDATPAEKLAALRALGFYSASSLSERPSAVQP